MKIIGILHTSLFSLPSIFSLYFYSNSLLLSLQFLFFTSSFPPSFIFPDHHSLFAFSFFFSSILVVIIYSSLTVPQFC